MSTSFRRRHINHPHKEFADRDEKCSACRWFEPRIFRETEGQRRYLVYRAGVSIVPGEFTRTSFEWLTSPFEVVEVLTTRKTQNRAPQRCPICNGTSRVSYPPGTAGDTYTPAHDGRTYRCPNPNCSDGMLFVESAYLTPPAARVLAQAANYDNDLSDSYVNRAVS